MAEKITFVHHYTSGYFGKPEKREYEGIIFENGKVALCDDEGEIAVFDCEDDAIDALEKHGKAEIKRDE